jgi:protein-S-isoprenylcysteine O-methyltransferase Ste14
MLWCAHPTAITMIAGAATVLTGEFLRLWGVSIAGSETRTTGPVGGTFLITTGPFAFVRNPLYVGNILLYCGMGIMSNALLPWLPVVALAYFLFQYYLIVTLEEEYLRTTFGVRYEQYCQAVPRFFPALKSYGAGTHEQPALEWGRGFRSERRTLQAISILIILLITIGWLRGS